MEDIYNEIVKSLEGKEELALATIIGRMGSAPREAGAKYLVKKEGKAIGSIGGGCVEADVWQEAQVAIERKEGKVVHFKLTEEQLAEGGLICGGNIDIFIEPLHEGFLNIYREVAKTHQEGGSGTLVTMISVDGHFPNSKGIKVFLKASGEKTGSFFTGDEWEQRIFKKAGPLLKENEPKVLVVSSDKADHSWKKLEILLEPIRSEPTVYVFGAGHISQQLVPIVKKVHFKVVVIDDREIFANRNSFPDADEVIVSEFERSFDQITLDASSYIIIVTRGHLYDKFILEKAIKTNARYIGMIGSKRKIQVLYKDLIDKGIRREILDRVHAPIGIDIGSETPEEIAVSIVAELIKERRGLRNIHSHLE